MEMKHTQYSASQNGISKNIEHITIPNRESHKSLNQTEHILTGKQIMLIKNKSNVPDHDNGNSNDTEQFGTMLHDIVYKSDGDYTYLQAGTYTGEDHQVVPQVGDQSYILVRNVDSEQMTDTDGLLYIVMSRDAPKTNVEQSPESIICISDTQMGEIYDLQLMKPVEHIAVHPFEHECLESPSTYPDSIASQIQKLKQVLVKTGLNGTTYETNHCEDVSINYIANVPLVGEEITVDPDKLDDINTVRELFGDSLEMGLSNEYLHDYIQQEITLDPDMQLDSSLDESGYASTSTAACSAASDADDLCLPGSPDSLLRHIPHRGLIPTSVADLALTSGDETSDASTDNDMEDYNDLNFLDDEIRQNDRIRAVKHLPKRRRPSRRKCPKIWQFLLDTLCDHNHNPDIIRWEEKGKGIFKIVKSKAVAQLWGHMRRPNNQKDMSYEHFSRALRYYYSRDVIYSVPAKRLTYQFGPNAKGWKASAKSFCG